MMEMMFYFMVAFWIMIFVFGLYTKSPLVVAFAGMLFISTGAALDANYIQIDEEKNVRMTELDSTTTDFNFSDIQHNPDNDTGLWLIQQVLFYGGFAVLAMSFGLFIYKWQFRKREGEEIIPGA